MKRLLSLLLLIISALYAFTQNITLNQVGFFTGSYKVAIVPGTATGSFQVLNKSNSAVVYTGTLGASTYWKPADANVRIADFTAFTTPGSYTIKAGTEVSYSFDIADTVLDFPVKTMLRGFYYWRCSQAISSPYSAHQGTDYARSLGHADNSVQIDGTAAYGTRTSGSKISSPKGWYDAGDYGKYMVTGAVSSYYLLTSYEQYTSYAGSINANIPESSNAIPDILDEAKWELDWLLTMQDPQDGGVYFQLTTQGFADWVQPSADGAQRYVYKKTTPSTLDFAAVMAVAYRVFKNFNSQYPGYADQCLAASKKAWIWANTNSSIFYGLAGGTGNYEDDNGSKSFNDEKAWAANELLIATNDATYFSACDFLNDSYCLLEEPSWQKTSGLGLLSLVNHLSDLTTLSSNQRDAIKTKFLNFTDSLATLWDASAYKIMTDRFWWGMNSIVATQGLFFLDAYRLTNEKRYMNAAVSHLDYIFGRNPTKYSYVTWLGDKTPQNPHDRRSASDGITKPIPGYLVAGACNNNCIDCAGAASSYADDQSNYTYNEIAINWNAPVVYLMSGIANTMLFKGSSFTKATTGSDAKKITISVSNALLSSSVSSIAGFTVKVGTITIPISGISIDATGKMITLSLSSTLLPTDQNITVSYTGTSILAIDNNPLVPFDLKPVENKLPGRPLNVLSIICSTDGKTITLAFDKTVATIPSPAGGFTVLVNGYVRTISAIAIDATDKTKINVTLATAVVGGNGINISYDGQGNVIATDTGILLPFATTAVVNPVVAIVSAKGYCDDFKDNTIGAYLTPASPLTIAESGEYMTITCNGQSGYSQLPAVIDPVDISANPKLVFRLQVSTNVTMRVDIGSYDGTQYVYTNTSPVSVNITGSANYQIVTFNYTNWGGSYPSGTVDPKKISKIVINFNPGSGFNGSVSMDYMYLADCSPSNDATLSSLTVNGGNTIMPKFDKGLYAYTVTLPAGTTTVPTISAIATNATATVAFTQATSTSGTGTVIVTAANGVKNQYTVLFNVVSAAITETLSLTKGWNMISFYVIPKNAIIDSVFATVKSSLAEIKTATGFYSPTQNSIFNSLTTVNNSDAYLVYMNSPATLVITGEPATVATTSLKIGWNLVGYPKSSQKTIAATITNISTSLSVIKTFTGYYQPSGSTNSITTFDAGKGYYIKALSGVSVTW